MEEGAQRVTAAVKFELEKFSALKGPSPSPSLFTTTVLPQIARLLITENHYYSVSFFLLPLSLFLLYLVPLLSLIVHALLPSSRERGEESPSVARQSKHGLLCEGFLPLLPPLLRLRLMVSSLKAAGLWKELLRDLQRESESPK